MHHDKDPPPQYFRTSQQQTTQYLHFMQQHKQPDTWLIWPHSSPYGVFEQASHYHTVET